MSFAEQVVQACPYSVLTTKAASRPHPLFILAPARSFSTVSVALLAGHPGLYGFPELLLFSTMPEAPTVGRLLGQRFLRRSGVLRAVAEVHEASQAPDALGRAEQWLAERGNWTTVELMDHLLDLISPRIGLEKSPDTVGSDQRLAACLEAYPDARFLHLTRHPVSTQRSMHLHWAHLYEADRSGGAQRLIAAAASSWYLAHRRIVRALSQLPPGQWIRVRAEDLVSTPGRQLPRILSWLDLPWDDQMIKRMQRTQDWRFAGTGTKGNLFGGDPTFMRAPALNLAIEPPPEQLDPPWHMPTEMRRRIDALAHHLGY